MVLYLTISSVVPQIVISQKRQFVKTQLLNVYVCVSLVSLISKYGTLVSLISQLLFSLCVKRIMPLPKISHPFMILDSIPLGNCFSISDNVIPIF